MNFIKIVIKYLLLIAAIILAGFLLVEKTNLIDEKYYHRVFPCSKPFEYSIGRVDPKFGISREELIQLADESEKPWEKSMEKNLFQYNPSADFKINLIYDERQMQSDAAEKMEENLQQLDIAHDQIIREYSSLSSKYKKRIDAYNDAVRKYEKSLEEYNKKVADWNARGGAPEEEYDKLKKEKKELTERFSKLEKERLNINNLAGKTNDLVEKENQIVDKYNDSLATYKSRFGQVREFEKGVFDGWEINIYQFNEKADLRLTLVHELGHALGIGHTENEKSIMYYLMGDQAMDNPMLTREDIAALGQVCGI